MTTNNNVNTSLSGQTGTGNFVGSQSPTIVTPLIGQINDTNGHDILKFNPAVSPVNYVQINNNSTGSPAGISVLGSDTNVNMTFECQGAGTYLYYSNATTNQVTYSVGASLLAISIFNFSATTGTYTYTFPAESGTIALTSQFTNWIPAATTPITAAVNTGYYITDASQVTITLPAVAAAGSIVSIVGHGAGGWILAPGSGQTIVVNGTSASTSITSGDAWDCIEVICVVANTTWNTRNYVTTAGLTIS